MEEERDESGKYRENYPDSLFIEAVFELPVASTSNIAKEVGCSYDLAYRRMNELHETGEVQREKVGGSFVYYIE